MYRSTAANEETKADQRKVQRFKPDMFQRRSLLPPSHGVVAKPGGNPVEVETEGSRLAALPRGQVRHRHPQQPICIHVEYDLQCNESAKMRCG